MKVTTTLSRFLSAGLLLLAANLLAQTDKSPREIALEFLRANPAQFGLTAQDVADVRITDEYASKNNGVTHVWVQQQHLGIPVFNGLFGLHVAPDGKVTTVGHRFVAHLAEQVNTSLPSLPASRAVLLAQDALGFAGFPAPSLREKTNERNFTFVGGAVSRHDIPVAACYFLDKKGAVRLAWTMVVEQANSSDIWNLRVDAVTGQILDKINLTVSEKAPAQLGSTCSPEISQKVDNQTVAPTGTTGAAATYKVFALPTESPLHGPQTVVTDPNNALASPYGWHDDNGAAGAEYTIPYGNNVHAYDDIDMDNQPPAPVTPDAGPTLNFTFDYSGVDEPGPNHDAAVVNLFYMNNMMHDILWNYGFDEPAGNFQSKNYGGLGKGNDYVLAEAQDGSGTDNANFATPADGQSGRMQMYVWNRAGGKIVHVNSPSDIIGFYSGGAPTWGGDLATNPVTADVVFTDDGSGNPNLGCNAPAIDVSGKIVMVDRGQCQFGVKALNVEQAGGVGCIICNFEDAIAGMAAGTAGGNVTIPVVMMTKSDCALLRQFAGEGLNITLGLPPSSGPDQYDGDFDNGIIAHEFGHGVSNRLTGGPSAAGCLGNAEQMGEGWSDFFSLVTTAQTGDTGTKKRGVGTYVLRQDVDGTGIRRYPYTTDMSINPLTFASVAANTEVHALGEVWTAMTWDLYWALADKYGFDPDWTNKNSGNARALQLVMDGMKLQPCSPGFQDGRDAIMAADIMNYAGVDTCLISSVFARRGLGYYASQKSSDNAGDGVENFDPIPTCIKELKITKTCTPLVKPGDDVQIAITVTNHKDTPALGVIVKDELPAGMTLKAATAGGVFQNGYVVWDLGTMPSGKVQTLAYSAATDPTKGSLTFWKDLMENEDDVLHYAQAGTSDFVLQDNQVHPGSGTKAWFGETPATATDFVLEYLKNFKVSGTHPTLRFWQKFNTEGSADAGFIEWAKYDPNAVVYTWKPFESSTALRGKMSGNVAYGTFAIPFLSGYFGNSGGWEQSYLDLTSLIGEDIVLRFRAGTDGANGVEGWYVDETEMIELFNYDGEACITDNAGSSACAHAPEKGIICQPIGIVGTEEANLNGLDFAVQPNPAHDLLSLAVGKDIAGEVRVNLTATDGKVLKTMQLHGFLAGSVVQMDLMNVPAGVYFVKLDSAAGQAIRKVVVW